MFISTFESRPPSFSKINTDKIYHIEKTMGYLNTNYKQPSKFNVLSNPFLLPERIHSDRKLQLNGLVNTLYGYHNLPYDWDGYEGVPAKLKTLSDCVAIVRCVSEKIVLPKPMLSGTGVVGLYWETDNAYLELCFEGDDTFWYYGTHDNDNIEIAEDIVPINKPSTSLPADILNFLKTHFAL